MEERSKEAEQALLELCSDPSVQLSKKQLLTEALSKSKCNVKEKHVKKAWRELERQGILAESKDGMCHVVAKQKTENDDASSDTSSSSDDEQSERTPLSDESDSDKESDEAVPFAEMLRRRAGKEASSFTPKEASSSQSVDVDEEIRRLEAELENDSSDSESLSEEEEEDGNRKVSFGATTLREIPSNAKDPPKDGEAILCLSSLADERIEPLPAAYLPQNKKRTLKGIDTGNDSRPPKKQRVQVSEGLKQAVKEVLNGYVARSSERLPFYCRVCVLQLTNEHEFYQHRQSDFHKVAVEMERKASYCKLCRKQFTSPVQLKEHVTSRPHRERLQKVISRQGHGLGRPQFTGHGRDRSHAPNGQSKRQWC